jgi:hypothetical protein
VHICGGVYSAPVPVLRPAPWLPAASTASVRRQTQAHYHCGAARTISAIEAVHLCSQVDLGWTAALLDDAALDMCSGMDDAVAAVMCTPFLQQLLAAEAPGMVLLSTFARS